MGQLKWTSLLPSCSLYTSAHVQVDRVLHILTGETAFFAATQIKTQKFFNISPWKSQPDVANCDHLKYLQVVKKTVS